MKKTIVATLAVLGLNPTFAPSASAAEASQCHDVFTGITHLENQVVELAASTLLAPVSGNMTHLQRGLDLYKEIVKDDSLKRLLPRRQVLKILSTEEMGYYPRVLVQVLETMKVSEGSGAPAQDRLALALRSVLKDKVPASTIASRIDDLLHHRKDALIRALGDMTFDETKLLMYGKNYLKPSPESLLGRYLSTTGAKTVVRTFNQDPLQAPGAGPQSPKRLVVAVSPASIAKFQELFMRVDVMSVIGHAYVVQNGKIVSYVHNYADYREQGAGGIFPMILLKTTEAQRTEFFLKQVANRGSTGWDNDLMLPWRIENFCSKAGAYVNCTHWIGNMPVGDKMVTEYTFPGAVDGYAVNRLANPVENQSARVAQLQPHNDPRFKKVYKVPGHMQFSEVLGLKEANGRADLANPGWLIATLIGSTPADRVPVVFYFVNDHTLPIDPNFIPAFERPL